MEPKFSTKPGDLLVIQMTNYAGIYIAEVLQEKPLRLKVEESGPNANLKEGGDFVIDAINSAIIQDEDESKSTALLREFKQRGYPLASGLRRLGVTNHQIREYFPAID